jgi:protein-disulfide isomerase
MSKKNRDTSRKVREMQAAQAAAERRRRSFVVGGSVLAVIVVVVGIAIVVNNSRDTTSVTSSGTPANVTDTYSIVRGDATAPVTVRLYEDFQCPICKEYEAFLGATYDQMVKDGTIKIAYHPMAFLDQMSSTDYSSRALETAACTLDNAGVDAYVKLHQLLYDNQPEENSAGLTDDQLADYASQAGADKSAVSACQADDRFADWVKAATNANGKDAPNGTPTMYVNDKLVPITTATTQDAAIQMFTDAVNAAKG